MSAVTDLLDRAEAGDITRSDLVERLGEITWLTFTELDDVYRQGRLSYDEQLAVARRFDRLHHATNNFTTTKEGHVLDTAEKLLSYLREMGWRA